MFQESFKDVSRKFQGCRKKVSRVFQGSFKDHSRMLQESLKGVSWVYLKGVLRVFQGCVSSSRSDDVTKSVCVSVCLSEVNL